MTTPSASVALQLATSSAGFHLAALVLFFLACGFYMVASSAGLVICGVLGIACEIGFWFSLWHGRKTRDAETPGNRG